MTQQELWNNKFSRDGYLYGLKENAFIASKIDIIKTKNSVLCLGEGEGRNAVFLAKNGLDVSAIDASDIGLKKLQKRSIENNLNIHCQCLDLNQWDSKKKYDVIVFSYLHLSKKEHENIFNKMQNSLNDDGYLIAEVFSNKQLNYNSGGPKDLDLLYDIDDFKSFFKDAKQRVITEELIMLDEGKGHQGEACVIRIFIHK